MSQIADEINLGEMLVTTGKLTHEELADALEMQRQLGGPAAKALTEILVESRRLTVEDLRTTAGQVAQPLPTPGTREELAPPTAPRGAGTGLGHGAPPPDPTTLDEQVRQALADPSRRIGRYVKVSELGRGGMGVVYRGYDPQLQRNVAIKMILDDTEPEDFTRFTREARAAAKLRHPGIVAVHEAGEHEGHPFLVMDFVEGESLDDFLHSEQLSSRRIAQLMVEVAHALDHAHAADIIHRDMKPANIMIDAEGHPHIMDFGLARDTSAHQRLTRTGQILGTPAFMAPEQAMADVGDYGPWTDVYALGAMLYEMLTGTPVFQAANAALLLQMVVTKDPMPPRQVNPSLPHDLETITLKCLEKDPRRRYASAGALADELQSHLDGRPIGARPVGELEKIARWTRRNPALATALAALVLVSSSAVATVVHLSQQQQAALEAARREGMSRLGSAERPEAPGAASEAGATGTPEATATPVRPEAAPKSAQEWLDLGVARSTGGDPVGAIDHLTRAIEVDQSLAKAWRIRGKLQRNSGELDAAIADITIALEIEPDDDATRSQLLSTLFQRGSLRKAKGEVQQAIDDFSLAIQLDPKSPQAWTHRGIARMERDELDAAIEDFDQAIGLEPTLWVRWYYRGYTHRMNGNLTASLNDFTRAIAIDSSHAECWLQRGHTYSLKGNTDRAIADFTNAITLTPNSWSAWGNRGLMRAKRGDLDGAIADFTRAIEINPNYATAFDDRGRARMTKGDLEGGIADHTRAIEIEPTFQKAWINRGYARMLKGDLDGAIADHTRAIEIDSASAIAWSNRGTARVRKGDAEGAIADYTRAIEIDPKDTHAWFNRGLARAGAHDLDGAIADYTRAIEVNPGNANAWGYRAAAHRDKGEFDAAITDGETMLRLSPNHPQAAGVRATLIRLRKQRDEAAARSGN